jgi:hypothetical protein
MLMPADNTPPNWRINFKVKPGFRPKTILYRHRLLALGEKHFEDRGDDSTPEDLPYTIVQGDQRFATPMFRDLTDTYSVVYSPDLRIYVRWGWWGEFGKESSTGSVDYFPNNPEDHPYEKKYDSVLNEPVPGTVNPPVQNYYSDITHFDIRFDDAPYVFAPYPPHEYNHTDEDGTTWLRLPIYSPLRQSIVLSGAQIAPGNHTFVVRAVDSQDEVSRYPAVLNYKVMPYIPPASRKGVLIIDDDVNNAINSPEAIVDAKYANMTSDIKSDIHDVTVIKYGPVGENRTYKDIRGRNLSFSDLQKYKMVIYHSDNPGSGGTFQAEVDGLSLFLQEGGNLVISHTALFAQQLTEISTKFRGYTLLNYLGLPMMPTMTAGPANPTQGPFFQSAVGNLGYPKVGLQYSTNPDNIAGTAAFHPLIENLRGFSAVAYHNEVGGTPNILGDPIFKYGCKPVDSPTSPPTQDQFDRLNGKVVGVRKVNNSGGKAYTFTFPLSFMLDSQTKALINKIWSELQ